ncbi:hypothetical protein [Paenibacillus polymyxa]|uniref:Uncharacterized protein n=1 Tax=Paenibacillus polymyxa (strain SC2) TaxID=886882 RepID=E3EKG8_PAEPS|nr:hypothetical protein [Paenibacillus polymyxa]ADO59800.1 hypothetical protein PPSC2_26160 [Paenibacillus polymyxa SC2]WPQ59965.1 hypothetical protein SKN87_27365 [Paenibacillus polymyxa]
MEKIQVEALYTLSGNEGIHISKGKEYTVAKVDFQTYELVGELNRKISLKEEELKYRFKML